MKKLLLSLLIVVALFPMSVCADNYSGLWKQVADAERKDLPKTQMNVLLQIINKAKAGKDYGQLVKAELKKATAAISIAPDSLQPMVGELVRNEQAAAKNNPVLAAVYQSVLAKIYQNNASLGEDHQRIAEDYKKKSMSNPALLAAHKDSEFVPLVNVGYDSRIYDNDLLSVLGYEADDFKTMHEYYATTNNRAATMLTALEIIKHRYSTIKPFKKSSDIVSLDSLINLYSDLKECGEVAIERYGRMEQCPDVTAETKIQYINYALSRWGSWPGMNELRNAQKELTNPSLRMSFTPVTIPDRPTTVKIEGVRNVNEVTMTVSKLALDADSKLDPEDTRDYAKLKKLIMPMNQISQTKRYVGLPEYKETDDSMVISGLPVGVYLVEMVTDNKTIEPGRQLYYVTDIFLAKENLPGNNIRYAVLNATTGQPVPGATLKIVYEGNYRHKETVETRTCDSKGELTYHYNGDTPDEEYAYTASDKACPPPTYNYGRFYYYENNNESNIAKLYTDRGIYRPGQTVHVSLMLFHNSKGKTVKALAGGKMKVTLRDANYKDVATNDVTTDDYGVASTDFVLPTAGLTGNFSIVCSGERTSGSTAIRVEEYKRPTFTVEFPVVNQKYQNGDTLVITAHAKTYAGVPVQGAKVKYKVTRRHASWWWFYNESNSNETMKEGTAVTDNDGAFKVEMPMVLPEGDDENSGGVFRMARFYNFITEADVTDVSGETHSGDITLPLGNRATAFSCDLPDKIQRDSIKTITFSLRNAAGKTIDGDVKYYIDEAFSSSTAKANTPTELKLNADLLASGKHHLKAVCGNDTISQDFIIFSMSDKRPCVRTHDWFFSTAKEFPSNGKPVYVQVGASDPDTHILYTMMAGNKLLESGVIDMNNALNTRKFTYKNEYGTGLLLTYLWVKDGKCYTHETTISAPKPDKRLLMKWTTFRNRLVPGQKEEWILNVTRPDGKPVAAQLMATLYDKSLDQIDDFDWSFNPNLSMSLPYTKWTVPQYSDWSRDMYAPYTSLNVKGLSFSCFDNIDILNTEGYSIVERMHTRMSGVVVLSSMRMAKATGMEMDATANEAPRRGVKFSAPVVKYDDEAVLDTAAVDDEENMPKKRADNVRENLNETAFFYPALMTDNQGNASIKFTLPESLTTWRFIGLSHDKDMNNGILRDEAVAKKDVMVQPNMPRFVRIGDQTSIVAKVFNTSDKSVNGTVRMELSDPATEKVVFEQTRPFNVSAGETTEATFNYIPDDNYTLLVCKIVASGKNFSDGEQHYLPILPNKEMVTNTVAFTQNNPGVKTIDLTKVFAVKDKSNKLTVEYTNNPAWLMMQTLPSIGADYDDNAISLAAAYYANKLSHDIISQSPDMEKTFMAWRNETGKETSMMSNLQKDQELKSMVLNETPWVMDAESEADQKQQLATFFDEPTMQYRFGSAMDKLQRLQNSDGSWSWWPGMDGSIYMTVSVSEMLVRLNSLIGAQDQTSSILNRAFSYMGNETVKLVEEMKKDEKKGLHHLRPNETAVHFLYLCALDGRQLPARVKSANDYLINLLQKNTTDFTIYGKSLTSVILAKRGLTAKAKEYAQSIKEYSVATEEMGRYYDSPNAYYSWRDYRIPTEVAAIEALRTVTPDDKTTVDEMLRWLLQSKRTQSWDTPINTTDAVYAFLKGRMEILNKQENTTLSVNGKALPLPAATAGMGYVKTSMTGADLTTFSADKTSTGTSWGAIYAQFMQKTSDIAASAEGISVKRELLNADMPLRVGDKVKVRITIRAARDYDFVQVTDKRAACMEPVNQLSGYHWGYYCAPKDNATNYYFDRLSKGTHTIETEYYVDRAGRYETGTCTAQCAYSPEYSGRTPSLTIEVK